jgi:GNAT superfamily N-acetyltransferase
MPTPLIVRRLTTDRELHDAFPVVRELRPRLDLPMFLDHVRRQAAEGYVLVGGYAGGDRPVVVAGYRLSSTLSRGPHLFVDDLVTAPADQGKGHGAAMLDWLRGQARAAGVERVYLDSRDTAVGFYERCGFTFLTSKPCWVDAAEGSPHAK